MPEQMSIFVLVADIVLLGILLRTGNVIDHKTCWQIKVSYFTATLGVFTHIVQFFPSVDLVCSRGILHIVSDLLMPIGFALIIISDRRAKERNCCLHRFRPN
jgi:hypothetical protein